MWRSHFFIFLCGIWCVFSCFLPSVLRLTGVGSHIHRCGFSHNPAKSLRCVELFRQVLTECRRLWRLWRTFRDISWICSHTTPWQNRVMANWKRGKKQFCGEGEEIWRDKGEMKHYCSTARHKNSGMCENLRKKFDTGITKSKNVWEPQKGEKSSRWDARRTASKYVEICWKMTRKNTPISTKIC